MANKIESIQKDGPYTALTEALNTPDIESLILVFKTKDGHVYSIRECDSYLLAVGMVETVKHGLLNEWEDDG